MAQILKPKKALSLSTKNSQHLCKSTCGAAVPGHGPLLWFALRLRVETDVGNLA